MMRRSHLPLDPWVNRLLVCIAALLAVIAVELWSLGGPGQSAAIAQVPDTALQRKQLVDEARRTNDLLSAILEHLRSKTVKVESVGPDKEGDESERPARRSAR